MKYYFAKDAANEIAGVRFLVTEIVCSVAVGIYATDNPDEIARLDAEVSRGGLVLEMTEAAYETAKKKVRSHAFSVSPSWRPQGPATDSTLSLKGKGAVVVSKEAPPEEETPVEIKGTIDTLDDALKIGTVLPPPVIEPPETKKPKRKR